MALPPGVRLGPYEILSPLGAGGMGEVYRAHDSRLDRTVAIKILPSVDPYLRARFAREAKAIAALQHPHICAIFDVGRQDDVDYLVLEYLQGQTVADRLDHGSLRIDETLAIAVQVAGALDKAHRIGVVHRDVKPSNVMLTRSGAKLLDFGLAKLRRPPGEAGEATATVTQEPSVTAEGQIVGTPRYMSPEQLEGKEADARSDVFAFGALVYEMTTGRKAFEGKSRASLIAAIMSADPPPMAAIRPAIPRALERLVRKCLAKDPEQRWQSAGDLADELAWVRESGSEAQSIPGLMVRRNRPAWIVGVIGALALMAALALVMRGRLQHAAGEAGAIRFSISPPEEWAFRPSSVLTVGAKAPLAVSPDGKQLAFVAAAADGRTFLWVRSLDSLTSRLLTGTDDASSPFWSPDSRSLGFFANGKLKKIDASGGTPVTLCDAVDNRGGAWGRDGTILFAPSASVATRLPTGLQKISASGGTPQSATVLAADEASHVGPTFLPDGNHFLYRALLLGQAGPGPIYLTSLGSAERKLLLTATSMNVASSEGHLLFLRERTLTAQPFDAERMAMTGEALPVAEAEDIGLLGAPPLGVFSASENGVLAFGRFTGAGSSELAWFDRAGKKAVLGDRAGYADVEISPDGRRTAVTVFDSALKTRDLWIFDLARGLRTRLTFDPAEENTPIWSPDGSRIVYSMLVGGTLELYQKATDGTGAAEVLLADHRHKLPACWSPDGRFILYMVDNGAPTEWDLWLLPLFGDRKPFPFLQTPFNETQGRFSPDGRWIAYVSNESGRYEVYVTPFPGPGGKWQISSGGGSSHFMWPRWRRDGKEITYLSPDGVLMAAAVNAHGVKFESGKARPLFTPRAAGRWPYDVAPDGRFLVNTAVGRPAWAPLTVVVNWRAAPRK